MKLNESPQHYWLAVIIFVLTAVSSPALAQAPSGVNYQAILRDNNGNALISTMVDVRFTILQNGATGTLVYQEEYDMVSTNEFGLFNLVIGEGGATSAGLFANIKDIDWSNGTYFLKVEVDDDMDRTYEDLGTTQLLSVPYALYAETAGNPLKAGSGIRIQNDSIINLGDTSNSNEAISRFELVNDSILILNEGNRSDTIDLSVFSDQFQNQDLNLVENGNLRLLSITGGNQIQFSVADGDSSATNEIQNLSVNAFGDSLLLSNGTGVLISDLGFTDDQQLTLNGKVLDLTGVNPSSVDLSVILGIDSIKSFNDTTLQIFYANGILENVIVRGIVSDTSSTNELIDSLRLNGKSIEAFQQGAVQGSVDLTTILGIDSIRTVDDSTLRIFNANGILEDIIVRGVVSDTSDTNELLDSAKLVLNELQLFQGLDTLRIDLSQFDNSNTDNQQLSRSNDTLFLSGDNPSFVDMAPLLGVDSVKEQNDSVFVYNHEGTIDTLALARNVSDTSATNELIDTMYYSNSALYYLQQGVLDSVVLDSVAKFQRALLRAQIRQNQDQLDSLQKYFSLDSALTNQNRDSINSVLDSLNKYIGLDGDLSDLNERIDSIDITANDFLRVFENGTLSDSVDLSRYATTGSDTNLVAAQIVGDSIELTMDQGPAIYVDITTINTAVAANQTNIATNRQAIIDTTASLLTRINADSLSRYINDTTLNGQLRDTTAVLRTLIGSTNTDNQVLSFNATQDTILLEDGGSISIKDIRDSIANYDTRIASNQTNIGSNQTEIATNRQAIIDTTASLLSRINTDSLSRYINDTTLSGQLRDTSAVLRTLIANTNTDNQNLAFRNDSILIDSANGVDISSLATDLELQAEVTTLNNRINLDNDTSKTNEAQTINRIGTTVTLSQANGAGGGTYTDSTLSESDVDAMVANNGYLTSEVDGDATNELQDLGMDVSQDSITISQGASVYIGDIRDSIIANADGIVDTAVQIRAALLDTANNIRTTIDNLSFADSLWNHIATKNISLNGNYISNDGGNEGILIDNNGFVGIGINPLDKTELKVSGTDENAGYFSISGTEPTKVALLGEATGPGTAVFALEGDANSTATSNYGLHAVARGAGTNNYGVFGKALGGTSENWAGYFADGNVNIENDLFVEGVSFLDSLRIDNAYSFPTTSGSANQVLKYNAAGTALEWGTLSTDGNGIYDGTGSLSGNTVVTQGGSTLSFTSTITNGFSVDGTTFSVDAANNRVGIGTASPASDLHVLNSGSTNSTIESTSGDAASLILKTATKEWEIQNNNLSGGSFHIIDKTSGNSRLVISPDGKIGIGTTVPTKSVLQVVGGFRADSLIIDGQYALPTIDGAADEILKTDGSGQLSFVPISSLVSGDNLGNHVLDSNLRTNGSWISNDGDDEGIQIGTDGFTTLSHGLFINSSGSETNYPLIIKTTSTDLLMSFQNNSATGIWDIETQGDNLHFSEAGVATRFSLFKGGNVGIGTSSASSRLHVESSDGVTGQFINTESSVSTTQTLILDANGNNANNFGLVSSVANGSMYNAGIYTEARGNMSNEYGIDAFAIDSSFGKAFGGRFVAQSFDLESYGLFSTATSVNGTSTAYGLRASASGAGNANYGIYAGASGGGINYAAYFNTGDVYVNDSLGIGVLSPTAKLDVLGKATVDTLNINDKYTFPSEDGDAGYVIQTDGAGNLNWVPIDTATCPTGMTNIAGRICIDNTERGTGNWFTAASTCTAAGLKLPTWAEWYGAMDNASVSNEIDNWEWVDDGTSNTVRKVGNLGLQNSANDDPASGSAAYRCILILK